MNALILYLMMTFAGLLSISFGLSLYILVETVLLWCKQYRGSQPPG